MFQALPQRCSEGFCHSNVPRQEAVTYHNAEAHWLWRRKYQLNVGGWSWIPHISQFSVLINKYLPTLFSASKYIRSGSELKATNPTKSCSFSSSRLGGVRRWGTKELQRGRDPIDDVCMPCPVMLLFLVEESGKPFIFPFDVCVARIT